jgi:hypothetical protein
MKPLHRIKGAASAAMKVLVQTSLLSGALVALVTGIASGEAMEKKGHHALRDAFRVPPAAED